MLLAEEFVLLALDPDGKVARGASNQPSVAIGVTGALVTELALEGHLELAEGRIHLTGTQPSHPRLALALENLEPHEGKKLKSRFSSIKHAGWPEVVDGMVDAGIVGREKQALHATRHPPADPGAHAALLAEVRAAATGDGPLDARMATLLALSGPCQLLEVVAPRREDRKAAQRRIAEAADLVPAAEAVKHVIETIQTVVIAAATSAAVVGGTGST
jgi:hypothetical protein